MPSKLSFLAGSARVPWTRTAHPLQLVKRAPPTDAPILEALREFADYARRHDELEEGLLAFNQLVSSMLSINAAHLEIAISSMTAISEDDCRFPPSPAEGVILPYETLIQNRSVSGVYAYEHHERVYGKIRTYLNRNRAFHPMDAIFGTYEYGEEVP